MAQLDPIIVLYLTFEVDVSKPCVRNRIPLIQQCLFCNSDLSHT